MAVLLQAPYNQFLDDDGNPLTGGKVYTYDAGTDTPKATYTDYTGTIPAANPVVLDAAGRADIWVEGDYKITVTDSDDVVIRTVDNIEAVDQGGDMTKAVYDPANISQQLVGLTAVQTLTNKTLTTPDIIGTSTNNNANAGSVGEVISSAIAIGSAVSLTTSTVANVTSISLTAGDWDIYGQIAFTTGASTSVTVQRGSISGTSATLGSDANISSPFFSRISAAYVPGTTSQVFPLTGGRRSLASTTTIYLVAEATFTVSTCAAYGFIWARRAR